MRKLKVLQGVVIGCGNYGTQEMRALRTVTGVKLIAGADIDEARLQAVKRKFGVKTFTDYREALDLEPDFVFIASVNSCHREQVVEAARRGIHVFCEKPIALTMADAGEMVKAVKKNGVVGAIGFGARLSPIQREIHGLIVQGRLGRIVSTWIHTVRGYGLGSHPAVLRPERSGGWIVHHVCHSADWFLWNFGPVKKVACRINSTLKGRGREEIVWAALEFSRAPLLGSLYESVGVHKFRNRGVVGTEGTVILDTLSGRARVYSEKSRWHYRTLDRDVGYSRRMAIRVNAFIDCIRLRRPVWAGMEEGREALRVTLAMQKAAETGRDVMVSEIK